MNFLYVNIGKVLTWPEIDPEVKGTAETRYIKTKKTKTALTSTSQNDLLDSASQYMD